MSDAPSEIPFWLFVLAVGLFVVAATVYEPAGYVAAALAVGLAVYLAAGGGA